MGLQWVGQISHNEVSSTQGGRWVATLSQTLPSLYRTPQKSSREANSSLAMRLSDGTQEMLLVCSHCCKTPTVINLREDKANPSTWLRPQMPMAGKGVMAVWEKSCSPHGVRRGDWDSHLKTTPQDTPWRTQPL